MIVLVFKVPFQMNKITQFVEIFNEFNQIKNEEWVSFKHPVKDIFIKAENAPTLLEDIEQTCQRQYTRDDFLSFAATASDDAALIFEGPISLSAKRVAWFSSFVSQSAKRAAQPTFLEYAFTPTSLKPATDPCCTCFPSTV